jgi:transposase InsO family protein
VASFHQAATVHGFPAAVLTDNGAVFTAAARHGRCAFELELARLGVATRHSRPSHPQTCGKVERFHQTLKRWLAKQPMAASAAELQAQLDAFAGDYNHHRPHRALGRRTPASAYAARPTRRPHRQVRPSRPTTASATTRSTAPGSSPFATTAGCTTSGSAAATPASASSSWWPTSTSGSWQKTER